MAPPGSPLQEDGNFAVSTWTNAAANLLFRTAVKLPGCLWYSLMVAPQEGLVSQEIKRFEGGEEPNSFIVERLWFRSLLGAFKIMLIVD